MDAELRSFLEKIAANLESRMDRVVEQLRSEMSAMETRLDARIDGVGRLTQDASRIFRTRDLRILTLEERVGEVEKRLIGIDGQGSEQ